MSLDEAQRFFLELAAREHEAERAKLLEPDLSMFLEAVRALDALYDGAIRSGISRPEEDVAVYASDANLAAAAALHPRSLFAVARYEHAAGILYRGWLGDLEDGRFGEGMRRGFLVMPVDGALRIVVRLLICGGCKGAGDACPWCQGDGWMSRGGRDLGRIGPQVELRLLQRPSDARYHRGYDDIAERVRGTFSAPPPR